MRRPVVNWKHYIAIAGCTLFVGCHGVEKEVSLGHRSAGVRSETPKTSADERLAVVQLPALTSLFDFETVAFSDADSEKVETASKIVIPVAGPTPDSLLLLPLPTETENPGQPDVSDGPLLTLDELQQLAMTGNPTLGQARALLQQAQGNWLQVGLHPNPVVGYFGNANNAPFDAHGGFVSQNIVTGNKLGLNREVAAHDVQRARWEFDAQHRRVINEIHIRYVAALGAQRQVALAEELLKITDEGVRISEQMLAREEVSRADVLQAQLQRNQTALLLRNAQVKTTATWQQLGNAIGWPDLPLRPLEGSLEEEIPAIAWESAWQQLLSGSPVIHAARSRVAAAAAQVRRENAQPIPDLQVTGSVGRDFVSPQFMMYGLQIGVTLPLFDRNQGNITSAVGELHAAQAEVARLELTLRDSLAEAFQRYQSARNEMQIYHETILPIAEENLSLTLKGYEEGEFDFLRVLTARQELFEAKINYVTALTELRIATIEIQGMLLTGGLESVNSTPTPSNQSGQTTGPGN